MGGYGSGRPGYKLKAEDYRALDIYKMKRLGCLEEGKSARWVWSRDNSEVASVGYHCTGAALTLDYRVRLSGGDWEPVTQTVMLTKADCHCGGQRTYAICSGVVNGQHCGRRVGKLFAGGVYFFCRHCYQLAYASQSELRYDRLLRRANKLRMALGGEPGAAHWIAPKPNGMWERTYERKRFEIDWCEHQANVAFLHKYGQFLSEQERKLLR